MKGKLHTRIASLVAILLCASLCSVNVFGAIDYTVLTRLRFTDGKVLFDTMADLMPGDTANDQVRLSNSTSNKTVEFYLTAEPANLDEYEGTADEKAALHAHAIDLLNQLNLTVSTSSGRIIYKGKATGASPAQGTALGGDFILITTLSAGAHEDFKAQLDVPITLGSEYMDSLALIEWFFYTKEKSGGDTSSSGGGSSGGGTINRDTVIIDDTLPPLGTVEITEGDVPLANLPKTGFAQMGMRGLILLSVTAAAFVMVMRANLKPKTK